MSQNDLSIANQGFASFRSSSGNITSFAGDATKLYRYQSNTFTDVSGGTTFNTPADNDWQFTQFGNYIIASNGADAPQVWQLANSSAWPALGGSPPTFWHSAVVRNFVVTGGQSTNRNRIQWSAIGNHASWTVGQDQADLETLLATDKVRPILIHAICSFLLTIWIITPRNTKVPINSAMKILVNLFIYIYQ